MEQGLASLSRIDKILEINRVNPEAERELCSFEFSVRKFINQSKQLAALKEEEPELIEELRQLITGLDYITQTLRYNFSTNNLHSDKSVTS